MRYLRVAGWIGHTPGPDAIKEFLLNPEARLLKWLMKRNRLAFNTMFNHFSRKCCKFVVDPNALKRIWDEDPWHQTPAIGGDEYDDPDWGTVKWAKGEYHKGDGEDPFTIEELQTILGREDICAMNFLTKAIALYYKSEARWILVRMLDKTYRGDHGMMRADDPLDLVKNVSDSHKKWLSVDLLNTTLGPKTIANTVCKKTNGANILTRAIKRATKSGRSCRMGGLLFWMFWRTCRMGPHGFPQILARFPQLTEFWWHWGPGVCNCICLAAVLCVGALPYMLSSGALWNRRREGPRQRRPPFLAQVGHAGPGRARRPTASSTTATAPSSFPRFRVI